MIVIGGGDSAMEDSIFISKYASELTMVNRRDEFRASKIMLDRAASSRTSTSRRPTSRRSSSPARMASSTASDCVTPRPARPRSSRPGGAFVAIGHIPKSEIVRGQVDTDEDGYIVTEAGSTRTNLAGVFAVGDVVDHTYRQAVTAAGTGCMGALDAEWYLRDTPPTAEAHWMPGGEPVEIAPTPGPRRRREGRRTAATCTHLDSVQSRCPARSGGARSAWPPERSGCT